jgi:hypothetical protein
MSTYWVGSAPGCGPTASGPVPRSGVHLQGKWSSAPRLSRSRTAGPDRLIAKSDPDMSRCTCSEPGAVDMCTAEVQPPPAAKGGGGGKGVGSADFAAAPTMQKAGAEAGEAEAAPQSLSGGCNLKSNCCRLGLVPELPQGPGAETLVAAGRSGGATDAGRAGQARRRQLQPLPPAAFA